MKLRNAVFACFGAGLIPLLAAVGFVLPGFAEDIGTRTLARTTQVQTQTVAQDVARLLESDWSELQYVVERAPQIDPERLGVFLDGLVNEGQRVAWAGYAGVDGVVRVASGGMLEGQDVSARPWFAGGLRGGFAGDVREAVLLQALLGQEGAEPLRFIDLAAPVQGPDGAITGVIGLRINSTWLERYLEGSAATRGMDFYMVSTNGSVSAASGAVPPEPLALEPFRLAVAGGSGLVREAFPEAGEQICAVVPQVLSGDLPSFGWRLVGCADYAIATAERDAVLSHVAALGLAGAAFFGLAAFAFARVFLAPVTRLVDSAERISRGEDPYPRPSRTSHEASVLAAALARLQAR
ncbi:cache domain-containing protein [Jannaschia formosa]|uniref:cache domain-containing protein n=1 Tax=Jannaschia formosa TaxID=2259592 RepID=UPI000E1BAC5A|nr:cache domain-containing protein [Jannaschia formosa]TFL17189.1 HAMP domain-containing protein [Jannaschia formosa]